MAQYYEQMHQDQPNAAYRGYESAAPSRDFTAESPGQKLAAPTRDQGPSLILRSIVAVSSLFLWIILFVFVAFLMQSVMNSVHYYTLFGRLEFIFLLLVLPMFTVLALVVNFFLNRKR